MTATITAIRNAAATALAAAASLADAAAVNVTGAAVNPDGGIRLAVANSAGLGGPAVVAGVAGTTEANGAWDSAIIVDTTHVDLARSVFAHAYVSGGTIAPNWPDFAPLVGINLSLSRSWPTVSPAPGKPAPPATVLLYVLRQRGDEESEGSTAPLFKTTVTLALEARIENVQSTAASSVDAALDALVEALKSAILQNVDFIALIETPESFEVQAKYDDKGARVVGEAQMAIEVSFREGFPPIVQNLQLQGANIYVDALNVFDPTGTYAPPFAGAPQTASPRSAGPDGRVEATAQANPDT